MFYIIAIITVLLYAMLPRTCFQFIIGGTLLQNYAFLSLMSISLLICIVKSISSSQRMQHLGKYCIWLLALIPFIAMGLVYDEDYNTLYRYLIALGVPFTILPSIKNKLFIPFLFVSWAIIIAFGCFFNYLYPNIFNSIVSPLFSKGNLDIYYQFDTVRQERNVVSGFTTNPGYASFFISIGFGTLLCFRKVVFKKFFFVIMAFLFLNLLLTGKRGPLFFLLFSSSFILFISMPQSQRFKGIFYSFIFALVLCVVWLLANTLIHSDGIGLIADTIEEIFQTKSIEDKGREQLYETALLLFKDNPILGIGWYQFKNIFHERETFVHNIYLQLLTETGITGFTVFILFFATNFFATLKKIQLTELSDYSSLEHSFYCLSLFIQLYILLYGFSGNPLYDTEEVLFLFFAIGLSFLPSLNTPSIQEDNGTAGIKPLENTSQTTPLNTDFSK